MRCYGWMLFKMFYLLELFVLLKTQWGRGQGGKVMYDILLNLFDKCYHQENTYYEEP